MDFVILIHRVVAEPYIRLIWYKEEFYIKILQPHRGEGLSVLLARRDRLPLSNYRLPLSRTQEPSMLLVQTSWYCFTSTSSEVNAGASGHSWPVIHPLQSSQMMMTTTIKRLQEHRALRATMHHKGCLSSATCLFSCHNLVVLSGALGSDEAIWRGISIFTASVLGLTWWAQYSI